MSLTEGCRPHFPKLLVVTTQVRTAAAVTLVVAMTIACNKIPTPDPNNELPFGVVDRPNRNQTVGRQVEVSGWAVDDSSVREIRLFVDGKYKISTRLTIPRPDVAKVHPNYTAHGPNHGWYALVDLGEIPGRHTILAQAVDDRGATRDLGSVVVTLIGR